MHKHQSLASMGGMSSEPDLVRLFIGDALANGFGFILGRSPNKGYEKVFLVSKSIRLP
jgi:hypothetical protein